MNLIRVEINRYKCFGTEQCFDVDNEVTVLVGMNEAGKTSVLEAIAKTNYFTDDAAFQFNTTHDFPRAQKKAMEKKGDVPWAVRATYEISDDVAKAISKDVGPDVLQARRICIRTDYESQGRVYSWDGPLCDVAAFVHGKTKELGIASKALDANLRKVTSHAEFMELTEKYAENGHREKLLTLEPYFKQKWSKWSVPLEEYIVRGYISPSIPKFLYYDEYYALPSRISIEKLNAAALEEHSLKTAKALFELANIEVDEIVNADDFEDFVAELEATEAIITNELFEHWTTNKNLHIRFAIDKRIDRSNPQEHRVVEHVLDIRVLNTRTGVSLPLRNRSKGFNWFFSFLVWFKKIQESKQDKYIILLDEPGLNLHASAQRDLLGFIESLTPDYQILFTTHSPFMIDSGKLHRVRTIVEKEKEGSVISETLQEKDPRTLFPLQAALGYDIAQNLFISSKNLLVEGVTELVVLQHMSDALAAKGRTGLSDDITIVPTGGLGKVATFVSLLRGSKLRMVCLVDSARGQQEEASIGNVIRERLISEKDIRSFDQFIEGRESADLEDMFEVDAYLPLFNEAFSGEYCLQPGDLAGVPSDRIVDRIGKALGIDRFNHYRPARALLRMPETFELSETTLSRFEAVFEYVNSRLAG